MQDYNHHKDIYKPEVIDSRLIGHSGNDFKIQLRLLKKKVITVVLDTYYDVHYVPVDKTRWYSRSYSTRIQEVDNAGKPDERLQPAGKDHGFLWRLYSYWRFVERDGGVYMECQAVSLTRDIPTGPGLDDRADHPPVAEGIAGEYAAQDARRAGPALVGQASQPVIPTF